MSIADQLITNGWTQGMMYRQSDGSMCIYGAALCDAGLMNEHGEVEEESVESHFIFETLSELIPAFDLWNGSFRSITTWNDIHRRTYDEVLRVAKQADEVFDALKELNEV